MDESALEVVKGLRRGATKLLETTALGQTETTALTCEGHLHASTLDFNQNGVNHNGAAAV
jgi:hypothetical protein